MKFEQIKVELEKFRTFDIMAASEDATTGAPEETTPTKYDPYESDKF